MLVFVNFQLFLFWVYLVCELIDKFVLWRTWYWQYKFVLLMHMFLLWTVCYWQYLQVWDMSKIHWVFIIAMMCKALPTIWASALLRYLWFWYSSSSIFCKFVGLYKSWVSSLWFHYGSNKCFCSWSTRVARSRYWKGSNRKVVANNYKA